MKKLFDKLAPGNKQTQKDSLLLGKTVQIFKHTVRCDEVIGEGGYATSECSCDLGFLSDLGIADNPGSPCSACHRPCIFCVAFVTSRLRSAWGSKRAGPRALRSLRHSQCMPSTARSHSLPPRFCTASAHTNLPSCMITHTVYKTREVSSGQLFALKHIRLHSDADCIKEVQHEGTVMAKLKAHPNILHMHAIAFAGAKGENIMGWAGAPDEGTGKGKVGGLADAGSLDELLHEC